MSNTRTCKVKINPYLMEVKAGVSAEVDSYNMVMAAINHDEAMFDVVLEAQDADYESFMSIAGVSVAFLATVLMGAPPEIRDHMLSHFRAMALENVRDGSSL